jgi:hypothetical protein
VPPSRAKSDPAVVKSGNHLKRRPRHQAVPRQGVGENLYFAVAGYTHGIFPARKVKRVLEAALP